MDTEVRTGKRHGMVGGITRSLPEVYSGNLPKLIKSYAYKVLFVRDEKKGF